MTEPGYTGGRLRAYLQFLAAFLYFFSARDRWPSARARAGRRCLVSARRAGHAGFSAAGGLRRHGLLARPPNHPISEQGLPRRSGWLREAGIGPGNRLGHGAGLRSAHHRDRRHRHLFSSAGLILGLARSRCGILCAGRAGGGNRLRGYAFQCFVRAVGPAGAGTGICRHLRHRAGAHAGRQPRQLRRLACIQLRALACYLRTRALWVSWGLNFGWKASRACSSASPSAASAAIRRWCRAIPWGRSGSPAEPSGSTAAGWHCFVLLAALPVVFRVTRDLNFRYNAPVIVPGGIPVDLDAAARAQHEAAMGPAAPAAPGLVQIVGSGTAISEQGPGTGNRKTHPTAIRPSSPLVPSPPLLFAFSPQLELTFAY
jgi:uncharacterized protein